MYFACLANAVTAGQGDGDELGLNGAGVFVAGLIEILQCLGIETELLKRRVREDLHRVFRIKVGSEQAADVVPERRMAAGVSRLP